jgi:hypothetical protein
VVQVSPEPMLARIENGVLLLNGAVDNGPSGPFVIDTGANITIFEQAGASGAVTTHLRLADANGAPRYDLSNAQLFHSELNPTGLSENGQNGATVSGIFAGDNLARSVFGFDLRNIARPMVNFLSELLPCSCELAQSCQAVFPFTLSGGTGNDSTLETRLVIGDDQYLLAPTRVVLDVCGEPLADPVSANLSCVDASTSDRYMESGQDLHLVVATGFPSLLLSANAWERLRGPGSAATLFAKGGACQPPDPNVMCFYLPGIPPSVDPTMPPPMPIPMIGHRVTLGVPAQMATATQAGTPGRSALALVSRERYFGPCGELARSRRQRRAYGQANETTCLHQHDPNVSDPVVDGCFRQTNDGDLCSDVSEPVAASIELTTQTEAWVVDDLTPIFVALNSDVRPQGASIDGVLGVSALEKLVVQIDYPKQRLVARCGDPSCLTYPSFRSGRYSPGAPDGQQPSSSPQSNANCENRALCLTPQADPNPLQGQPGIAGIEAANPSRLGGSCAPLPLP